MGGAEKMLCDIIRAGVGEGRCDYEVLIINDLFDDYLLEELRKTGAPVHLIRRPQGSRNPLHLLQTRAVIGAIRPDVCHCHGFHSLIWAKAATFPLLHPLFVWTIHDTQAVGQLGGGKIAIVRAITDRVVAISKAVETECLRHGLKQTVLIYNGIDLARYRLNRPESLKSDLAILCVGRLSVEAKGHDTPIRALSICREAGIRFTLSFVGGEAVEEPRVLQRLQALVQAEGLDSQVTFLGKRGNVPDFLIQADLFVLPSRYEGFGLVLVEAMAAGVPVIASDIEGPRELLADGEYGMMFTVGDPASLAEALQKLHNAPDLRRSLAERGRGRAEQFSIEQTVAGYEALYG